MTFFAGLDAAIALFKRWRWLIIAAPLLIALAVQSWRLNSTRADLAEAQATIAQMQLASEQAKAAQLALNAANQQLAERIADNALAAHVESRPRLDRAIRDYARGHGLRQACGSLPGSANPAAVPSDPGAPDSPDAVNVVAVPRADFEALAADALRAAEARAFLIDLANEGLAVIKPVPAPSQP